MRRPIPPHITAQIAATDASIACERARNTCNHIIKLLDNAGTRHKARREVDVLISDVNRILDAADLMIINSAEPTILEVPKDYAEPCGANEAVPQPMIETWGTPISGKAVLATAGLIAFVFAACAWIGFFGGTFLAGVGLW